MSSIMKVLWSHGSCTVRNWNDATIPKDTYFCARYLRGRVIAEERKKMVEN